MPDGTSNTILLGESAEEDQSRWCFGGDMEMIAMDAAAVDIVNDSSGMFRFAYPNGFDPTAPKYFDDSSIVTDPATGKGQPFAAYSYNRSGASEPTYKGKQTSNPDAIYGPSSDHPAVVNHLFADGSTSSLSKRIDAAAYMFMVTRNAGDLAPPW